MAEYCYTEWRVFCLSLMLSITYKPSMLSGIMLNVVMLSVAVYEMGTLIVGHCQLHMAKRQVLG
jgi:hypothetical protein